MAEIIKHKKEAPLAGLVGMGGGLTGFGLVGPGVTPPGQANYADGHSCLLYTSPSPRDS